MHSQVFAQARQEPTPYPAIPASHAPSTTPNRSLPPAMTHNKMHTDHVSIVSTTSDENTQSTHVSIVPTLSDEEMQNYHVPIVSTDREENMQHALSSVIWDNALLAIRK